MVHNGAMDRRSTLNLYTISVVILDVVLVFLASLMQQVSLETYLTQNIVLLSFFTLVTLTLGHLLIFYIYEKKDHSLIQNLIKEDQRKLRLLESSMEQSSDLLYWIDTNNQIMHTSRRTLEVLGYSRDELLGQSPEVLDATFRADGMNRLRHQLRTQIFHVFETVQKTKNGTLIPMEVVLSLFLYDGEEFLTASCRDIRPRLKAAKELSLARNQFEHFMRGLPGGAFIKHPGGELTFRNDVFDGFRLALATGFLKEEFQQKDQVILSGLPCNFVYETKGLNNRPQFFEVWQFPLDFSDQEILIGGVVFDITERKLADNALADSQAFLEATIHQSPVGIVILDGNTTSIRILNQGAKEIMGISPTQILAGQSLTMEGIIGEVLDENHKPFTLERNPMYRAFFREAAYHDRVILRRPDGREKFVLINSGPINDSRGQMIAAMVALLDITDLHEAETQLQNVNKRLEARVEERTQELVKTIENLTRTQEQLIESEKFASLGSLVAGVAHEINTPVGVSVTAASFLKEETDALVARIEGNELKKSDLHQYISHALQSSQIILSNLQRASNLIKSFKMISADQSMDQRRKFLLVLYFRDVFLSLHPTDKKLHLKLEVEGDEKLELNSFPGVFSQIVTNLYMNSCIHGFEGQTSGKIVIQVKKEGEEILIVYRDDGRGMEETTLKKIYDPFFTTRRDLGGTGLGMNIVFNLVNQKLGGSIKAWSQPDQGVEFQIRIPATESVNFFTDS